MSKDRLQVVVYTQVGVIRAATQRYRADWDTKAAQDYKVRARQIREFP